MGNKDLLALDIYSLIIGVTEGKLGSFGMTFKILVKNKHNENDQNKCDICTWDRIVDFH